MITEEDIGNDEFLYKSRRKYTSLSEALVIFPYGLGTNAKIHGIRGLLFKIYPHEQQRNRSICRMIDQGILASSLVLQTDESGLATVGLQYLGNTAVLGPDWKAVPMTLPDLQRSVMPAIDMMERLGNDRVAGYSSENVFDGDQRKTKFEVAAHMESAASLSDSAMDFFYSPYERLTRQSVKRMTRRDYVVQDPGGREIADLLLRLVKKGVPLEAFYRIDHKATKVVRAIGAGSAAAKTLSLDRMGELRPRMDDVGQARLDRSLAVDAVGVANADGFFPKDMRRRTTVDTNIAILENGQLLAGARIPVLPSDKHLAHAREHIKPLLEGFEAVEAGQAERPEVAVTMDGLYNHCAEHVTLVEGDPSVQEEAALLRQMLQQVGEVITNGLKEAEKLAEEAEGEEGAQEGPDPERAREVERHRQKMSQTQEMFDLKMRQEMQKADVKIAIDDAKAASQIARSRKVQGSQQQQDNT